MKGTVCRNLSAIIAYNEEMYISAKRKMFRTCKSDFPIIVKQGNKWKQKMINNN